MTPDDLQEFMADHGASGTLVKDMICMHSDYWNTTATLQFMPRSRRVRVAYDATCRARYREFQI